MKEVIYADAMRKVSRLAICLYKVVRVDYLRTIGKIVVMQRR